MAAEQLKKDYSLIVEQHGCGTEQLRNSLQRIAFLARQLCSVPHNPPYPAPLRLASLQSALLQSIEMSSVFYLQPGIYSSVFHAMGNCVLIEIWLIWREVSTSGPWLDCSHANDNSKSSKFDWSKKQCSDWLVNMVMRYSCTATIGQGTSQFPDWNRIPRTPLKRLAQMAGT